MSERWTEADKREAFAAWDEYRERFAATVRGVVGHMGADALLNNPLVSIVYADGYLVGRAKEAALHADAPTWAEWAQIHERADEADREADGLQAANAELACKAAAWDRLCALAKAWVDDGHKPWLPRAVMDEVNAIRLGQG